MKKSKIAITGLVCATILSACSHGVQIAEHADQYNNTVEQVENRMLLKNVVRASKRMPLHFTRIADVKGSLNTTASTGSFALPSLGANGTGEAYSAAPSFSTSSSPSYTMQVLASEEFFKGIMTPVNIETMRFFVDQGWPIPILMFLFVERIDVSFPGSDGSGEISLCSIDNDPLNDQRWEEFEAAINVIEGRGTFKKQNKNAAFGPIYKKADLTVEDLVLINDAKFKLADVSDRKKDGSLKIGATEMFQVKRASSSEFIDLNVPGIKRAALAQLQASAAANAGNCPTDDIYLLAIAPDGRNVADQFLAQEERTESRARLQKFIPERGDKTTTINARLQLRPALNQIYFLGELLRYQRVMKRPRISKLLARDCLVANADGSCADWGNAKNSRVRELRNPMALFNATTDAASAPSIRVNVTGENYTVPAYPNVGRTTQFLTLVRQIFQLNISEENFPTSQTVQLVTRPN